MKCCVPLCRMKGRNNPPTVLENQERVTFHEFPTNPSLRESWLLAIGIQERSLPRKAVVCSQHFQRYDISMLSMRRRRDTIPSIFKVPKSETSTIEFCLICLDSGARKLFPLDNNRLEWAYTDLTGLKVSVIGQRINNVPKLCPECAQRLTNCVTFKDKILRAHSLLIQLLLKNKTITSQTLKSINRSENLLTSNIVKHSFAPDHCDLYLIHNEEDNNIRNEENIKYNLEEVSDTRSEKFGDTLYESEKDSNDYEVEYLSESDIYYDVPVTNNNAVDTRNTDKYNSFEDANDKEDAFISWNSDDEVEFLDSDIGDDIKHEIDNDGDFDIDIEGDNIDKLSNGSYSNDRLINKLKVETVDRVSLNNLIFVKDTKPKVDIDELSNDNHSSDTLNKLKVEDSDNKVSLNNLIFVKYTKPIIQHKDIEGEKDSMYQNQNLRLYNEPCRSKTNVKQTINKILTQRNAIVKPNNNSSIIKQNKTCQEVVNIKYNSNTNNQNEYKIINENTDKKKLNNNNIPGVKNAKDTRNVLKPTNRSNIKNKDKVTKDTKSINEKRASTKRQLRKSNRDKIRELYAQRRKTHYREVVLKFFTKTSLTHEEQIANIQQRGDTERYQKSLYKCDACFTGFWQLDAYIRHLDKHTDEFGRFVCAICGLHSKTRTRLITHLSYHSDLYSCILCPLTTTSRQYAIGHEHWHTGKSFQCKHCGEEFSLRSTYLSHLRIKHPSDYVCALCGFSFVSPAGVKQHMNLMHRSEDVDNFSGPSCEECNVRFASETAYQQHMAVSPKHAISGAEPKRNVRQLDFRKYYNYYMSNRGQRLRGRAREGPRFLCELCGQKFYAACTLREHMGVHTGDKMYKCEICHKAFAHKVGYNVHMATHGDDPPRYPCNVCGVLIANMSNLRRHMQIHLAMRPMHVCNICEKAFTSALGLEQHVSHVHFNVPWPKRNRRGRHKPDTQTPRLKSIERTLT